MDKNSVVMLSIKVSAEKRDREGFTEVATFVRNLKEVFGRRSHWGIHYKSLDQVPERGLCLTVL